MPVYRTPDGKIIEENVNLKTGGPTEEKTVPIKTGPVQRQKLQTPPPTPSLSQEDDDGSFDVKTVPVGKPQNNDDPKTRLIGGRKNKDKEGALEQRAAEWDAMEDPVVGWLVVVRGPGGGRALPLGYGVNSIGRGAEARVQIDFGDDQISHRSHAKVTYDPKSRQFYVQHDTSANVTYLNDSPVLAPTLLPAFSDVIIGATTLRFVPFCSEDFDWRDMSGPD